MNNFALTLLVTLSDPKSGAEHIASVAMHNGLPAYDGMPMLQAAVKEAAESFARQLVADGAGEEETDAGSLLIDGLRIAPLEGQTEQRYLVEGTYSDYPEGGCYGDWFDAVSDDDAELQARFTMAYNENDASFSGPDGQMTADDFENMAAWTLFAVQITANAPDPLTHDEAIALVKRLAAAGAGMIAAYGNWGSPLQQDAAGELSAAVKEGQAAVQALAKAFPHRHAG